jgi:hypothetical protein
MLQPFCNLKQHPGTHLQRDLRQTQGWSEGLEETSHCRARQPGCSARSEATIPMHQMEMRGKPHTPATLLHEVQSSVSWYFSRKYRNTTLWS